MEVVSLLSCLRQHVGPGMGGSDAASWHPRREGFGSVKGSATRRASALPPAVTYVGVLSLVWVPSISRHGLPASHTRPSLPPFLSRVPRVQTPLCSLQTFPRCCPTGSSPNGGGPTRGPTAGPEDILRPAFSRFLSSFSPFLNARPLSVIGTHINTQSHTTTFPNLTCRTAYSRSLSSSFTLSDYKYLSYNELFRRIEEVGSALQHLGLKEGSRVSVYAETSCVQSMFWLSGPKSFSLMSRFIHPVLTGSIGRLPPTDARAPFSPLPPLTRRLAFRVGRRHAPLLASNSKQLTPSLFLRPPGLAHSLTEPEVQAVFTNAALLPTLQTVISKGAKEGANEDKEAGGRNVRFIIYDGECKDQVHGRLGSRSAHSLSETRLTFVSILLGHARRVQAGSRGAWRSNPYF